MKAPDSVIGPNDDIVIPPNSTATDYEVELAIVIGKRALYLDSRKILQPTSWVTQFRKMYQSAIGRLNVLVNGLRESRFQPLIQLGHTSSPAIQLIHTTCVSGVK